MTATRRQVLVGTGTALAGGLAGCSSESPSPCVDFDDERNFIEQVDLQTGARWFPGQPQYVADVSIAFAFATGGTFELWVVEIPPAAPLARQEVPPERSSARIENIHAYPPLAIEARGHDDRLLDRVAIRAPGECSGGASA